MTFFEIYRPDVTRLRREKVEQAPTPGLGGAAAKL
jgi:hypothetical protein